MNTAGRLAVVVPIKSFTSAKARLADVLSPTARATLARACAETVLRAAQPLPVFVVCDDHDVATWAANRSATVVRPDHAGLNAAATVGRAAAALAGFQRVLLIHSDLPRAESLATLDDVALLRVVHEEALRAIREDERVV